ncbi:MAG TPA: SpvB/TcaC N-terminal domain-containing protein, partial [Terrimicrobiaceae bacterium]
MPKLDLAGDARRETRADGAQQNAPLISLPKGGGAIRGMGEKFAVNPVTGTGAMSVPILTSPGRSGFGPQLSLSYDSGSGNGPFGLGWTLDFPQISRKTEKGLPTYQDDADSDVFLLSGAEDLMPLLVEEADQWVREIAPERVVDGTRYRIQRYRPRLEGLFASIERWTNTSVPAETFWRSISRDNVTTWYGRSAESRIADPAEPSHIFAWLICESYDDKGNVMEYSYKPEDSAGIDVGQEHERNRSPETRSANRYVKRIRYGNRTPYFPELSESLPWPSLPEQWLFEVVFDYGEHSAEAPTPSEEREWLLRSDPFSFYRSRFEIRSYRLCQRVLTFHHVSDTTVGEGYEGAVQSTDFAYSLDEEPKYARNPIFSFLLAVTQVAFRRESDTTYTRKSLPPIEFDYTRVNLDGTIHEVDRASL